MNLVDPSDLELSIKKQCDLLQLSRSSYYYSPAGETAENLGLMEKIDEIYTNYPFYGVRRISAELERQGYGVNVKRIRRLMRKMALEAIYPKKNLSRNNSEDYRYPYLLKDLKIERPNQVWGTDITYIKLRDGFMYLVAIIDWYSRFVLGFSLSNTLGTEFVIEAVEEALQFGKPEIFNSDQGSQFTSLAYTGLLKKNLIQISMDGRGRCYDNIFTERLWRSLKYELIYLNEYRNGLEVRSGIKEYFRFYNEKRVHQSLNYLTPAEVYKNTISI